MTGVPHSQLGELTALPHSWNKGDLLLREGKPKRRGGVQGREEEAEGKGREKRERVSKRGERRKGKGKGRLAISIQ